MKRDYLSVSALKAFMRSPNHYIQYVNREQKTTKALAFGSAVHTAVLEPDEWDKRYAVAPKADRRTKAGKESWAAFEAANQGKEVIPIDDYERIICIRDSVSRHSNAAHLLRTAQDFEQRMEGNHFGYKYVGIADVVGNGYVADLKTTQDASPSGFQRSASNFGYHLQAALYRELFGVSNFYWIAVETQAPWNVVVYEQTQNAYDKSIDRLRQATDAFKRWDGQPGSYTTNVLELDLPPWG